MAVVTILPDAVRGSLVSPSFAVAADSPPFVRLSMTSPTFATDPTLHWDLVGERSFDGGATWQTWFISTNVGGGGLASQNVHFDGQACLVRANVTVPTPFTWGLTGEILVI